MSDYEEDGNRNDLLFLLIICSEDYLPSVFSQSLLSGCDIERKDEQQTSRRHEYSEGSS